MKKSKILAVLVVSGVFMAFAMGSGSSGKNTTSTKVGTVDTDENDSSDAEENEETETTETTAEGDAIENKSEIYVGDSCMDGNLKITYTKSGEYISDNQFIQPADGNKYVYIELYCENTGDSDERISYFNFDCYADGYAVDQNYGVDSLSATLSAGRTTTGIIVFEIPVDAQEVEFEYSLNAFTSDHVKFIYEGEKDSGFVPEKNTDVSEDVYHKGDIVETNQLRITYLSCGEFSSDNMFIQPKDGYKYLYAELEFENISDSDQYVSSFSFDCFADGEACSQSYYTGDDNLDATISAGRKAKGKVVFEIPEDATTVEFEYLDNAWTSGRIVFLYE